MAALLTDTVSISLYRWILYASVRVHSHRVKANSKAKKITEPAKEIKEKFKHQRKFSFSFSLSFGVNGLLEVDFLGWVESSDYR